GTSHLLPGFASRLAGLPPTATDQTVTRGLRLALAAERYSPWRLWIESARTKRGQAQVDPTARRTRKVRIDLVARSVPPTGGTPPRSRLRRRWSSTPLPTAAGPTPRYPGRADCSMRTSTHRPARSPAPADWGRAATAPHDPGRPGPAG